MKNLSNLTKRSKILIIIISIVIICGVSLCIMYVTGVFPSDTKGSLIVLEQNCIDKNCPCHDHSGSIDQNTCRMCEHCCPQGNLR